MGARLASLFLLVLSYCAQAGGDRDLLYQVSTVDALLSGVYDSVARVGDLAPHGDFGLGTFEALDGEMILLDGIVYQAAFDGSVNRMPASTGTPFMAVTSFETDRQLEIPESMTYRDFKPWLEERLSSLNLFYGVRLDGQFASIRYRSVARQKAPYPPLVEVTRGQAIFDRTEIRGTLVGFWCPAFAKGINVPGLHLHFLSADRMHGGHVLDFRLVEGTARLDETNGWTLVLPSLPEYLDANLAGDRSLDLDLVEKGGEGSATTSR